MADEAGMNVEVWDATGNKKVTVNLPRAAPVNRIIVLLVERMNLPRHSPDGQLMSYKFHHKASGRQLLDEETLQSASVKDGDVLRLQPEITAGGRAVHEAGRGCA
ncbi:MAG TPA: EsaB/YukD family protein [Planctomycetota bacterium]|nr:EsaB/YukD family protein [Planctomycetota bacterium]